MGTFVPVRAAHCPEAACGRPRRSSPQPRGLVTVLKKSLTALDALFDEPSPACCGATRGLQTEETGRRPTCISTSPPHGTTKGVARFVASGELGSGVMFDPVDPEDAACRLKGHDHHMAGTR